MHAPTAPPILKVLLIGLTGGMGAGKSAALSTLQRLGAETLSTDEVVHELYSEPAVIEVVVARLGAEVAPGGEIDRSAVAAAVFADPAQREWLEQLIWPLVGERIAAWTQRVRQASPEPRAAVLEVPLLFESGLHQACDATIAILASPETIARRTADRGLVGVSQRNDRQISQEEKAARASFAVSNDGDLEELEHELSRVLDNLKR
jgi:dephospho-CoA kinase